MPPVLGVVYAPAMDLLYSAGSGLGAWKADEEPGLFACSQDRARPGTVSW